MTEEQILIVDENNKEIGVAPRSEMRAKRLWHRGVSILLFNSKEEIFVHQRTFDKDIFPGYYDLRIAGGLVVGETYEDTAVRELEEETGLKNVPLKPLFILKFDVEVNKGFTQVFKCVHDGPLQLEKEEIIHGGFMSIEELKGLMKKEKFVPEAILVFNKYLEEYHDH